MVSKKFQTHPLKSAEADPRFRKVSLSPAKLHMLFAYMAKLTPDT